jgi:hypothetical protein
MRPFRLATALGLLTVATGCGGANPAAPTKPAVMGLAIIGAEAVLTGVPSSYTVTATLRDGTSRTVIATWSSSDPQVAAVDSAGQLEGRAHGVITLSASAEGQTVSKTVRVVNNYAGTWAGRFVVKRCDPPSACAAMEVDFFSFDIGLEISQTGTDQSDIKARLILPDWFDIHASISGRVSDDGRLDLAGSSEQRDSDGTTWATVTVGAWDTTLSNGAMTGHWAQRLNVLQPRPSTEYMENELETMNRISNTARAMSVR